MGFFDKMTKAVGDAVDKTKREADQFMRIQKIKGEIGEMERKIAAFTAEITQVKADAGVRAIAMMRAGTLSAPELQPLADRIVGLEQQIETEQAAIVGKRVDIEKVKAEDAQRAAAADAADPSSIPAAPALVMPVPRPAAAPPSTEASVVPPPVPDTPVVPPVPGPAPLVPPPIPPEEQK